MTNCKMSVVIPAYNEEKYISECIESLRKQECNFVFEIIVVDNNSTDNTIKKIEKYNVRILKENKQGVGAARKKGTNEAIGEIVIQLDADSRAQENYLQSVKEYFYKDKNLACLGGQYIFYDAPWWKDVIRLPSFYILLYLARLFSWGQLGPMGGCMAFRKNLYNKTKGFNENLKYGEDADICRKLSEYGKIRVFPKLKCYTSVRRFKINFHLVVLGWQAIKMVFNKDSNYDFPHSSKLQYVVCG
jgi:glycosyltransferase involved in cell wall biosynthesis